MVQAAEGVMRMIRQMNITGRGSRRDAGYKVGIEAGQGLEEIDHTPEAEGQEDTEDHNHTPDKGRGKSHSWQRERRSYTHTPDKGRRDKYRERSRE